MFKSWRKVYYSHDDKGRKSKTLSFSQRKDIHRKKGGQGRKGIPRVRILGIFCKAERGG